MTTADRVLAVLRLFTLERPEWTVEEVARELGLSQSTAYQYVRSLVEAGLIVAFETGRYVVGPAIIELDRLTRRSDPFIRGAQAAMDELASHLDGEGVALLCRLYRRTVMCVDQRAKVAPGFAVSYERGRPMPLFRGSASKVILAHLPLRLLRRHYEEDRNDIAAAGLGADWESFRSALRDLRKEPVLVSYGEIDPGLMGLSAPVFGPDGDILGSIGLVVSGRERGSEVPAALVQQVAAAGRAVTASLADPPGP